MNRFEKIAKNLIAEDATQKYKSNLKECRSLIKKISKSLDKNEKAQKQEPKNWGYTGSIGKVQMDLKQILDFIGE